jgi:hypothetical protein
MATYYVDSNAAGAGTGANWANAFTTLNGAFSGKAAGDIFYVAHNHAQTQASALTLTPPGNITAPNRVICVNSGGSVPPVSADLRTTASITTTGANTMTIEAGAHYEGIIFNCGTGATNAHITLGEAFGRVSFRNCQFKKLGTTAVAYAVDSNYSCVVSLDNCTFEFGNVGDAISLKGVFEWKNTASAIAGATIPTTGLFLIDTPVRAMIEGVDLSAMGSGSTLFRAAFPACDVILKDCKLGASVVVAGTTTAPGQRIMMINCDSSDTNYRSEKYDYQGVLTTETTTVRTGGASNGTTTIAWKIDPNANNELDFPFEAFPISVWNETVGSVTVTVEGTWAGGAVPTTADIWMDVEYLGTSGFPLGSIAFGRTDSLSSTNHTASTETWGAGGTTKFKMAKTVTVAEKGPITAYIKYANVTNNVWIDPKITVS